MSRCRGRGRRRRHVHRSRRGRRRGARDGEGAVGPGDQSAGVAAALAAAGIPEAVDVLAHGTTVATNALLERRGARTALVTTEGFRDVIEIGRQNRPSLYDLTAHRPAPLVPRELRFTVRERVGPEGVRRAARRGVVAARGRGRARPRGSRPSPSASSSRSSHPEHERRVGEALRARCRRPVSLSSELLPEFREYERCSTTVANAYLGPALVGVPGAPSSRSRSSCSRRRGRRRGSSGRSAPRRASSPARPRVSIGAAFVAGAAATATCSRSTWAGRARTSPPCSAARRR